MTDPTNSTDPANPTISTDNTAPGAPATPSAPSAPATPSAPGAARPLVGRAALVAGGTRGAGRGIATQLGAAGATVYVTGRSSRATGRSDLNRPETIEATADLVTEAGGLGVPITCDHSDPAQVRALTERIAEREDGQLDVLVNDIWGGDSLIEWKPVWEHDLDRGLAAMRRALETHVITSHHASPLLIARGHDPGAEHGHGGHGLVVEITDGDEEMNALFPDGYRGGFFYDLIKKIVIQLAKTQAAELRPHGVAAVALTPGFLRSEEVLDHFGVREENWRDGIAADPHFAYSETPAYIGRAVAALAAAAIAGDPDVLAHTGASLEVAELAREYGFTDLDGSQPDFKTYFRENLVPQLPSILEEAQSAAASD